ncbi:class I SAM-dependent methyltransferase [Haloimpatiens sp. FM7315]|uniref:class I SAM-dependent methyltransferase n=1 Tax=Haloimpatiens sp. FM7315 TaxID=3298609 RepID=UPI0035A3CFFF
MNEVKEIVNVWDIVAEDFGKSEPRYWNDFGYKLVEYSNITKGNKVLDIAVGRGASLFPSVNKVKSSGYVVGIDSSKVMIEETHKDILSKNIVNAEVKVMDADELDFPEDYFDNVVCGFGIGYLLLGKHKLKNVIKVLKTGGQVAFSIWGVQEDQKWLGDTINRYLKVDNVKDKHKNQDIPKFDDVKSVEKILKEAGFKNIKVHEEVEKVIYKDKNMWWKEMHTNAVRKIFDKIESLGFESYVQFKVDIFNDLDKFKKDNCLHFNMPVIYAFGEK